MSFKVVLRKAVLTCLGREASSPYLEEAANGVGLQLNAGGLTLEDSRSAATNVGGGVPASDPITRVVPLVATKTVLLVTGGSKKEAK